jgi:hypothetical protein
LDLEEAELVPEGRLCGTGGQLARRLRSPVAAEQLLLGIDIGTASSKAVLTTPDGAVAASRKACCPVRMSVVNSV